MKKLVYILVAVFTMVSVNAFGTAFELHYAYPGGNAENDAVVNEIIFKDVYNHNYNTYSDASYTNEIEFKAPTCKGYKFAGYFLHWTEYGVEKSEMVIDTDCDLLKHYCGDNDYPIELYAHWEKDTENFIWEDDGSGFYGTDKHHRIDYNSFTPWNHMFVEDTTTDINEVEVSNEVKSNKAEGIYTLNGVKVKEITQSGIYIVNGKKTFVKK